MDRRRNLSLSFFLATMGIFFVTFGFANEFVAAADVYADVALDGNKEEFVEDCTTLLDPIGPAEWADATEQCQKSADNREIEAMIDFIISGLQVVGGILLWVGMSGYKKRILELTDNEMDIKSKVKILKKGLKQSGKEMLNDED